MTTSPAFSLFGCLLAGSLLATTLVPKDSRAADPPAAAAAEETVGKVDATSSRVYVRVGKRRLGHEHGVEGKVQSGHIVLGADKDAGELVFDMASFAADTDTARKVVGLEGTTDAEEQGEVTKTMRGAGVLNTKKHATAKFVVNSSKAAAKKSEDGHDPYVLEGEFTLLGQAKALTVTAAAVETKNGHTRLKGQFALKQTDYGIKPYSTLGGIIAVADEVQIHGDIWVANPK